MDRNSLFIVETHSQGASMGQVEKQVTYTVVRSNVTNLEAFCQKLPTYLKDLSGAKNFENELAKATETLKQQNYVQCDFHCSDYTAYITIIPPKFD